MGGLQRFGPFVVCRSIGRGGMGEVFLARTPWEAQPLAAVKRLRPDVARVPTFRERFRHEAELARRLSHPNLVGTLDIGEVEGQVYVATELVLGKDTGFIADRLRLRSQGGPVAVAIRLLLDGLAGLAYVHGAQDEDGRPLNLVHRDVTPGNLLLGYDGRSRLADFGLAKSYLSEGSGLTKQGEILGTPHYLPPEVVRGERARPASDIYGLGAVAYRFLTGIAPFQGSTSEVLNKVLKERPRPLAELRPDLPAWLADQVESMLEPNLQIRPAKAEPLIDVILSEARQAQMLVPRAAVGRWLAQLFGPEHAEEMEEYERLVALSPEALAVPREGTQVLVPAHGSSATADPTPETPFRSEADFDDRPGGALDATTDEDGTELELSASRVLGISPPLEAFEEDLVPTRAVEVPSSGFDFDTDLEGPAGEERRHGFVDHVDVDAAGPRSATAPSVPWSVSCSAAST
ncbi:MAG: serine/threonine-protein kinase, partial [Myxococcota bacterium]